MRNDEVVKSQVLNFLLVANSSIRSKKLLVINFAVAIALAACSSNNQSSVNSTVNSTPPEPVEVGQAQTGGAQPGSAVEASPIAPVTAQPGSAVATAPIAPVRAKETAPIAPVWAKRTTAVETAPIAPVQAQATDAIRSLDAETNDREVRIILPADVLFDFDKSNIRSDAAAGLQQMLTVIRFYKTAPISIQGHTDSKGDDAYNQALSNRRAKSVKQWLITQGQVASNQMTVSGFGESQPRASNTKADGSDDPAGRQLNRRVEVVVEKQ